MKFGIPEIGLILLLVLIIFGPGRLPQVSDFIGKTIRNIRGVNKEMKDSLKSIDDSIKSS